MPVYQEPEWVSVDRAVEAGKAAGIPVMVVPTALAERSRETAG